MCLCISILCGIFTQHCQMCTVYCVWCTQYSVRECIVWNVFCTLCSIQCRVCMVSVLFTVWVLALWTAVVHLVSHQPFHTPTNGVIFVSHSKKKHRIPEIFWNVNVLIYNKFISMYMYVYHYYYFESSTSMFAYISTFWLCFTIRHTWMVRVVYWFASTASRYKIVDVAIYWLHMINGKLL